MLFEIIREGYSFENIVHVFAELLFMCILQQIKK